MGYVGPFPMRVEQGGTGEITLLPNAVLVGENADDIGITNVGTNGQLLIGATSAKPLFATLTSTGGTIAYTLGANSLNLEATGSGTVQSMNGDTGILISGTTLHFVTGYGGAGLATTSGTPQFIGSTLLSSSTMILIFSDGIGNTLIGTTSRTGSPGGNNNTALGVQALGTVGLTGSHNSALGNGAGSSYTGSESSNVCINHPGVAAESHTLRIGAGTGTGSQQLTRAFIFGIDGVNVGSVAKVLTMASDQLGTATITAGTGISVTPGANTITIASTAVAFTWNEITGASASMAVNNGYIANNAGLVTLTLPATAALGDVVRVTGKGTGGWSIAQNSGQTIFFGTSTTTTGVGGSLASTQRRDSVELVCVTANNDWNVLSVQGSLTVV